MEEISSSEYAIDSCVSRFTWMVLEEASKGYQDFEKGAAKKFVIDPHGTLRT